MSFCVLCRLIRTYWVISFWNCVWSAWSWNHLLSWWCPLGAASAKTWWIHDAGPGQELFGMPGHFMSHWWIQKTDSFVTISGDIPSWWRVWLVSGTFSWFEDNFCTVTTVSVCLSLNWWIWGFWGSGQKVRFWDGVTCVEDGGAVHPGVLGSDVAQQISDCGQHGRQSEAMTLTCREAQGEDWAAEAVTNTNVWERERELISGSAAGHMMVRLLAETTSHSRSPEDEAYRLRFWRHLVVHIGVLR